MKKILLINIMLAMGGCVTLSGTYVISAYDSDGKLLTGNRQLMAQGSGVYTVIGGICAAYPKSIVLIKDAKTHEELKGESPHQCR